VVHDGLWESAARTSHSLPARLAVEHCVHEARGCDILPQTVSRFRAGGDEASASLLWDTIYQEEITHCAAGVRWLRHLHAAAADAETHWGADESKWPDWVAEARGISVDKYFQKLVRQYFFGRLRGPFNDEARKKAGFEESWYLPLAELDEGPPGKGKEGEKDSGKPPAVEATAAAAAQAVAAIQV
jgi:uncharacterized ferritin-like protein (DUF455 family)